MAFEWLAEPVSEEEPCGPDLEATDDGDFIEYYYEAESRMPERYFTPGMAGKGDEYAVGVIFDRKSISMKEEMSHIEPLLRKSRDLRLLSLWSRLAILAGNLESFADALEGTAAVLEAFPNECHPRDMGDKRGALDELGNNTLVITPLQYAELAGSGEVSLRRLQVAAGDTGPREGELGLDRGKLLSELGSPSARKSVDAAHAALTRAANALDRIRRACLTADSPFNPNIGPAAETVGEMMKLINSGRNDLPVWSAEAAALEEDDAGYDEAAEDGDAAEGEGGDAAPRPARAPVMAAVVVETDIPNRAAAVQTLSAIETYFAVYEPAAPALLLITQARLLVGRPLIEALQTLLPYDAPRTQIDFGGDTGFKLDMDQLIQLANNAPGGAPEDEDPGTPPVIRTRPEAAGHLASVEEFFRAREPASPVPVLLFRARTYLEKDFTALVKELIPPPPE